MVLTGAMRPATSREADGPAQPPMRSPSLPGRREPAWSWPSPASLHRPDVRKVHSSRLDAFSSAGAGPLGRIEAGRLEAMRPWPAESALGLELLPPAGAPWPWVEIVASAAGVDGRAVRALADAGVDGLVVAATGNGSVHRELAAALEQAASPAGIPVLRATRCLDGGVARREEPSAFASAGDLTPVKARVELVLQLLRARRPGGAAPG